MKTYHATLHLTPRTDGFIDAHIESDNQSIFGNQYNISANTPYQVIDIVTRATNRANWYNATVKINADFEQVQARVILTIKHADENR